MKVGIIASVAALAFALGAGSAAAAPTRWSGTAVGTFVQTRSFVSTDASHPFTDDDVMTFKAKLTFSLVISRSGAVTGNGTGTYTVASWHSQGSNRGASFSCAPVVSAPPFTVAVAGRAVRGHVTLRLGLVNATETNGDLSCGAGFRIQAGSGRALADSLASVGSFSHARAHASSVTRKKHSASDSQIVNAIPPLRVHTVQDSAWNVSVHRSGARALAAAASGAPELGPGEAFGVAGTDIVCSFGGPANQWGVWCRHSRARAATYSFRLSEAKLIVERRSSARTRTVRAYREALQSGFPQPHSPALSKFKLARTLRIGQRVLLAGSDIACNVSPIAGKPVVACAKFSAQNGSYLAGSYGAAMSTTLLQVAHYDKAGGATSAFLAREGR